MMVALSRLAAVQNPIIPMYREREIGHILDEARVDAMIVVENWGGVAYKDMAETLSAERGGTPVVWTIDEVLGEPAPSQTVTSQSGAAQKPARVAVLYIRVVGRAEGLSPHRPIIVLLCRRDDEASGE